MIVTPKDVIKMCKGDMSTTSLSRTMGRSDGYISSMLAGRSIGSQPMVDILDALGYDTIVRNRATHEEVRITPSREEVIVPHSLTLQIKDDDTYERVSELVETGEIEDKLRQLLDN